MWLKRRKGQSMVEYGLILSAVAIAVIAGLSALGDRSNETFSAVNDEFTEAIERFDEEQLDRENRKNIRDYERGTLPPNQGGSGGSGGSGGTGGSGGSGGSGGTGGSDGSGGSNNIGDRPPKANFTWRPNVPQVQKDVRILNTSYDPDGDRIVKEEWKLNGKDLPALPRMFPAGDNELSLRVMDETGNWSTWVTKTMTVANHPPTTPTITYTPKDAIISTTTVDFTASSTDPNGDEIHFEWRIQGVKSDNKTENLKHRFPKRGEYTVEVIAVDEWGLKSKPAVVIVHIQNSPPTDPTLKCTPSSGKLYNDTKITCTASGSVDPDGDSITYEYRNVSKDGFYKQGTHTVQARAVDSSGEYSNWVSASFTIDNRPPTKPQLNINVREKNAFYSIIELTAYGSHDPDGDPVTYEWIGKADNNRYYNGTHTVRVRARDSYGSYSEWAEYTFDTESPMKTIFEQWENYIMSGNSGEWRYDPVNDYVYTTKNVHWTGFYNPDDLYLRDYRVSWDSRVTGVKDDDTIGMTFRMLDDKNFYFIAIDNQTHNGGAIHGGIYKMVDGKRTLLREIPYTWTHEIWDSMSIEVVGNKITAVVDGKTYTYTDNNNPYLHGSFGPFTYSQANGYFRNIRLQILD